MVEASPVARFLLSVPLDSSVVVVVAVAGRWSSEKQQVAQIVKVGICNILNPSPNRDFRITDFQVGQFPRTRDPLECDGRTRWQ